MRTTIGIHSLILLLWILMRTNEVNGKKILVIVPAPSYSHQVVFRALCLALNKRGHEMIVVTTHPMNNSTLTNYTEIDFSLAYEMLSKANFIQLLLGKTSATRNEVLTQQFNILNDITRALYNNSEIRKLYESGVNEKFDAIIVEALFGSGIYALAHRFKAPLIGILSVDLHTHHHFTLGNPVLPSHPSNWEQYRNTGTDLSFWTRVMNFIDSSFTIYRWCYEFEHEQDKMVREFLGNDVPYIREFAKNMSLILSEHDPVISYARPVTPNTIFYGGFHILRRPPHLPKKMKQFLDNATNGFIYMSLGTNMKSTELPSEILKCIINVFSKLPYKVLWKFEGQPPSRKPNNVFIAKWIPQQSVLAHPNIKLFIYQGGLQSTEETIHYAVPIVGIPAFYEQGYRIIKLESLGVGRHLELTKINEETFHDAISDVLSNKRYKTKMKELRSLVKDKPYDSMEHAIWWIEYVMRHNGAPHLRFSGIHEPWYQRYDMDLVALLSIIVFIPMLLFVLVLIQSFIWSFRYFHVLLVPLLKDSFLFEKKAKKVE